MRYLLLILSLSVPAWPQQNTGSAVWPQSKATVYFYQSSEVFRIDAANRNYRGRHQGVHAASWQILRTGAATRQTCGSKFQGVVDR